MNKLNWQGITEILAAASIVLSMIFVGYEIRENSAVARATLLSTFALEGVPLALAQDAELASLMRRVAFGESYSDFDADEQFRITMFYQALLNVQNAYFVAAKDGVLEDSDQNPISNSGAYDNDFFRITWNGFFRTQYSLEFVEFLESLNWNSGSE